MEMQVEFIVRAIVVGIGATLVLDLWSVFLYRAFGIQGLSYPMVGRWLGHLARGRLTHESIGKAAPIAGEAALGWGAHYAIGVLFAGVLLVLWGVEWAYQPTLLPALIVGIGAVVAPFFILQPGMGAGIAASKTPKPNVARLRSLIAHTVFGLGLYLTAVVAARL